METGFFNVTLKHKSFSPATTSLLLPNPADFAPCNFFPFLHDEVEIKRLQFDTVKEIQHKSQMFDGLTD